VIAARVVATVLLLGMATAGTTALLLADLPFGFWMGAAPQLALVVAGAEAMPVDR
jgi:flagellar biosynthesis protein FliR